MLTWMRMRIPTVVVVVAAAGCTDAEALAVRDQKAAGPSVTVTPRVDPGQLAVSWTTDPVAVQYLVFRSAGGGAFTFLSSVSGGIAGPPATSYIDTGLSGGQYCYEVQSSYDDGTMSGLSAPGCGLASGSGLPPTVPLPSATTWITVPGSLFAQPDIHVGINGQVYAIPASTGAVSGVSITGQCSSSGFIIACARIRERGSWDWCSPSVACVGRASAVVPLATPITLGASVHVDIALMSGPAVATSPFGVYTTM